MPEEKAGEQVSSPITLQLYRQLSVVSLQPRLRRGVCCEVEFDQPAECQQLKQNKDRAAYWESGPGSKILQHGTLIALVFNAKKIGTAAAQQGNNKRRQKFSKKKKKQQAELSGVIKRDEKEEKEETEVEEKRVGPIQCDRLAFGVVERAGGSAAAINKADRCRALVVMLPGHGNWQALTGYGRQQEGQRVERDNSGRLFITESVMLEMRGHLFAACQSVLSGLQHIDASSHSPHSHSHHRPLHIPAHSFHCRCCRILHGGHRLHGVWPKVTRVRAVWSLSE